MLIRISTLCAIRNLGSFPYGRLRPITSPTAHILRTVSSVSIDNSKVEHSQFLATASSQSNWKDSTPGNGTTDAEEDELTGIEKGVGQSVQIITSQV